MVMRFVTAPEVYPHTMPNNAVTINSAAWGRQKQF